MSHGTTTRSVACPSCGATIDVSDLLYRRVEEELRSDFERRFSAERKRQEDRSAELDAAGRRLADAERRMADDVRRAVERGVAAERSAIEEQVRRTAAEEEAGRVKALQEELERKSEQVRELHRVRAEVERVRREKDEMKDEFEARYERTLSERLQSERAAILRTAEERNQMKLGEKDSVIRQLRDQLEDARRKAEQGSVQLQGEVQELAIEEWLRSAFPHDLVAEVKKGARGADCLHVVNAPGRPECGSIYYESKRTKEFQPAWIAKFKADMLERGATIGVIVTEAMPREMDRVGLREGVWICSFEEFKGLSAVLRDAVIRISQAAAAQENRGDKMALLYDYLTGDEFRLQVEAIAGGFSQMQADLAAERRAMEAAWKKREKQLENVLLNTSRMYGSVRAIAGAAVPPVGLLELDGGADPPAGPPSLDSGAGR